MSRTINKVELLGRVGVDPEMQYTPGGTAVTKLRLATDRYRKDAEPETDWHNIVVWSATAEAVNQYVAKGDRIYVAGRLVQNSWEGDDGQRRPPHRGPRLRGRVPRLPQREWRRRRHGAGGGRLALLARRIATPSTTAQPATPAYRGQPGATLQRGRFPSTMWRPRSLFQPIGLEARHDQTPKTCGHQGVPETLVLERAAQQPEPAPGEIAPRTRYEVETQPERVGHLPGGSRPVQVASPTGPFPDRTCGALLGPEMNKTDQEPGPGAAGGTGVLLLRTPACLGRSPTYESASASSTRDNMNSSGRMSSGPAEVLLARNNVIEAVPVSSSSVRSRGGVPARRRPPAIGIDPPFDGRARRTCMITRKLKQAADLLDIELLDHVVIGRGAVREPQGDGA